MSIDAFDFSRPSKTTDKKNLANKSNNVIKNVAKVKEKGKSKFFKKSKLSSNTSAKKLKTTFAKQSVKSQLKFASKKVSPIKKLKQKILKAKIVKDKTKLKKVEKAESSIDYGEKRKKRGRPPKIVADEETTEESKTNPLSLAQKLAKKVATVHQDDKDPSRLRKRKEKPDEREKRLAALQNIKVEGMTIDDEIAKIKSTEVKTVDSSTSIKNEVKKVTVKRKSVTENGNEEEIESAHKIKRGNQEICSVLNKKHNLEIESIEKKLDEKEKVNVIPMKKFSSQLQVQRKETNNRDLDKIEELARAVSLGLRDKSLASKCATDLRNSSIKNVSSTNLDASNSECKIIPSKRQKKGKNVSETVSSHFQSPCLDKIGKSNANEVINRKSPAHDKAGKPKLHLNSSDIVSQRPTIAKVTKDKLHNQKNLRKRNGRSTTQGDHQEFSQCESEPIKDSNSNKEPVNVIKKVGRKKKLTEINNGDASINEKSSSRFTGESKEDAFVSNAAVDAHLLSSDLDGIRSHRRRKHSQGLLKDFVVDLPSTVEDLHITAGTDELVSITMPPYPDHAYCCTSITQPNNETYNVWTTPSDDEDTIPAVPENLNCVDDGANLVSPQKATFSWNTDSTSVSLRISPRVTGNFEPSSSSLGHCSLWNGGLGIMNSERPPSVLLEDDMPEKTEGISSTDSGSSHKRRLLSGFASITS